MAKLILKSPYLKPLSKSHTANYVRYIATRDGVVKPDEQARGGYVDYIATRPGVKHGLFSDVGKPVVLRRAAEEAAQHSGNVWTHIISLRREDADRLDYSSAQAWVDLLRRQRNNIARQMKIDPKHFRWYAAFHDHKTHPHVHMIAWSTDPKEAYLSREGIEGIKSALARDIFKQDLVQIYEQQTRHRDDLRREAREIVQQINAGDYENPVMQELLLKLSVRLKNISGKKVYGYLPADAKATVDRIVDELAKDERIARLYDLWYEQREAVLATHRSDMPTRVPLSQNNEFKTIKNAVIAEAVNLVPEQKQTTQPSEKQQNTSSSDVGDLALGSMRLIGQLSQMIENKIEDAPMPAHTESKLWQDIQTKKREQGLK